MSNNNTYIANVGRLSTDRFDFQKHVDGYSFKHNADDLNLNPSVTIDGYTTTNVQEAIERIAITVNPPVIQDASVSNKGIIKLANDLGGTADAPTVIGLRNFPVDTATPNTGDILTWDGLSWGPAAPGNAFIADGDLSGNNISQTVVSLTGASNIVDCIASDFAFNKNTITPRITQTTRTASGDAEDLTIQAQATTLLGSGDGGNVIIKGGTGSLSGQDGGVILQVSSSIVLQVAQPSGSEILALKDSVVTSTHMPSGTGDLVFYVGNANTNPSVDPVDGAILYASGGGLYIRESTGDNFKIGSTPNPNIWGDAGEQVYSKRVTAVSSIGSGIVAFSYLLPDNTSTKVDVIAIGKHQTLAETLQMNLSMGYVRHGGAPVAVGSLVTSDERATALAAIEPWVYPEIDVAGNYVIVNTGYSPTVALNWFFVIQLSFGD